MTYFVRLDLQQSLRPYWQAGKYRGDTSGIWGLNEKKKKGIITLLNQRTTVRLREVVGFRCLRDQHSGS